MEEWEPSLGRREVLVATSIAAGSLAGCSTVLGQGRDSSEAVSMLAAGSLNNALENGLQPTVDPTLQPEARGSAQIARLVATGQKAPDIVSVADVALFDTPLQPDWFAEFATNSLVVAYNPETDRGQQVAAAGPESWFRPILDDDVALGRTDPDQDPLGYRALFMLALATDYYATDEPLREVLPSREQIFPETQLVSQFETGAIDAAIVYRNMAVERNYDFVELPPEINLSDPGYRDSYATATYELPSGTVVSGGPISYASTIRDRSPAVLDVFDEHITGQYLNEFGFSTPEDYPRYRGNVPTNVAN